MGSAGHDLTVLGLGRLLITGLCSRNPLHDFRDLGVWPASEGDADEHDIHTRAVEFYLLEENSVIDVVLLAYVSADGLGDAVAVVLTLRVCS